ncbi:PAS domain-containing protein [Phenylobacterium sp.]|uniref:PAS domain-containing protein n=1 Tax=Phenylobacterium sp. TaxID=1871053 RepID=UPI003D2B3B77
MSIQGSRATPGALAASLFDASEDCVKIVSLEGDLLAMNANGVCLMEIEDFEALRGRPWASLWPDREREVIQTAIAQANGGRNSKFVADCPTGSGTLKSWEVVVWPVLDEGGRPREIISISRDVTESRRLDEERSLFTRELAHRIKNMFAVVDGVISLSARGAAEARPTIEALRARLHGLGRAIAYVSPPELLGREAQSDHTLLGLLRVLLEPYGGGAGPDQRVFISGDDAPIGKGATTSVALVVHELATNAMKYGALSTSAGRVDVEVVVGPPMVQMIWRERGSPRGPGAPPVELKGFGSVLVENAVTRQLAGRYTRDWRAEGIVVDMTFPADRIAR